MEYFVGRLLRGNQVVFPAVSGSYWDKSPHPPKELVGNLTAPNMRPIMPGDFFRLELDDGRAGDIAVLSSGDTGDGSSQTVEFGVNGPIA